MAKKDLTGQRFNMLTVLKEDGKNKSNRIMWLCKCDCGNLHRTAGKYLLNGDATSCGCRRKKILEETTKNNTTHKMTNTRLYHIWQGMRHRCNNPNDLSYSRYGGRGITICPEWNDFMNFYNWAMNNGYSNELTIDRVDVNGAYEPKNCRWADHKTQGNNTRRNHYLTYNGITKSMSEWADEKQILYSTLRARINSYHWSIERALETPAKKTKKG